MADSTLKRLRDEPQVQEQQQEDMKRYKSSSSSSSYNQILNFLESEEEEPIEDISSLILSLQQEISYSEPSSDPLTQPISDDNNPSSINNLEETTSSSSSSSSNEEEDKERVMRYLLEASDDELGIPEIKFDLTEQEEEYEYEGRCGLNVYDGLWELEDEAANYYTLLQSELFL